MTADFGHDRYQNRDMVITRYIVGLNEDVDCFVELISSRMERIHESSGLPQLLPIFFMEVDGQSFSRTRIKVRVSLADGMLHTVGLMTAEFGNDRYQSGC
jgi:hypothetical protein